jgi:hypothetical protein
MKKILSTVIALCFSFGAFAAEPTKAEPKPESSVAQTATNEVKPEAPKAEAKKSVAHKAKKVKKAKKHKAKLMFIKGSIAPFFLAFKLKNIIV